MAKVTNEMREIIRSDSIEPPRSQARQEVPFERVPIALFGPRPQIAHGSFEPLLGNVGEPEARAVDHLLTPVPATDELIATGPGCRDPAGDRPPPLLASGIPEPDFEHTGASAVDVAFNPLSTREVSCFSHNCPSMSCSTPMASQRRSVCLTRTRSASTGGIAEALVVEPLLPVYVAETVSGQSRSRCRPI
jgi:hypothetical protein